MPWLLFRSKNNCNGWGSQHSADTGRKALHLQKTQQLIGHLKVQLFFEAHLCVAKRLLENCHRSERSDKAGFLQLPIRFLLPFHCHTQHNISHECLI